MTRPGMIVWLTGRPAAGKSTLAAATAEKLRAHRHDVVWLDSDRVRATQAPELGFDARGREAFYAYLGDLVIEAARDHEIVLVSATAPYARYRDAVRRRAQQFIEVFVTAGDATLATRDSKGLYAAAHAGSITDLPGVGSPYEAPAKPELVCATDEARVDELADRLVQCIEQRGDSASRHPTSTSRLRDR